MRAWASFSSSPRLPNFSAPDGQLATQAGRLAVPLALDAEHALAHLRASGHLATRKRGTPKGQLTMQ